ncbi:MAG: hypothetical protein Q7J60_10910, partial [Bradyrhizobium sp.]|nr:hypothetical protein [Bradyrhizobium sp.]
RQQHADDAGKTQLVSDTIELDHEGRSLVLSALALPVCRAWQVGNARRPHQTPRGLVPPLILAARQQTNFMQPAGEARLI